MLWLSIFVIVVSCVAGSCLDSYLYFKLKQKMYNY